MSLVDLSETGNPTLVKSDNVLFATNKIGVRRALRILIANATQDIV